MKRRRTTDGKELQKIKSPVRRIPAFPDYAASMCGNIISYRRSKPRLMIPVENSHGYMVVTVRGDNRQFTETVHRLVAQAFFEKKSTRLIHVNHKNGNKHDNSLSNLELITAKENTEHAINLGLRNTLGINNPSAKLSESDVIQIKKLLRSSKMRKLGFQSSIARHYGVTKELIYAIRKQRVWGHLK